MAPARGLPSEALAKGGLPSVALAKEEALAKEGGKAERVGLQHSNPDFLTPEGTARGPQPILFWRTEELTSQRSQRRKGRRVLLHEILNKSFRICTLVIQRTRRREISCPFLSWDSVEALKDHPGSKVSRFKTQEKLCVLGVLWGERIQINPLRR